MIRHIAKKLREDRGFTLIELMVVVVILGILAAVAIPSFTGKADTAKIKAAKADLKTIGTAIELYYVENDDYPNDWNALTEGGYLTKTPYSPWNTDYHFDTSNGVKVWVELPNGLKLGSEDKNNDSKLYYPDDI
ncbi:type II secretion system protein [Calderihabitans maritimus]|uniref:Type II secretion system protein G n=1 Tax=Calderihabitans maritimus TaxID=1246530 RepID=A0A1Z5HXR8_9FIRM|nr:prepilin-type N-terminal cleavage/methylation domain-containing protein [Calderihabitans maritimus]GAW94131.1 type II secretion system protein G [Calderihabitans maritimus]